MTDNSGKRAWVTWLKRGLTLLFFILVPLLLFNMLRGMDWAEVRESLLGYSIWILLAGFGIAVFSYFIFSSYDVLAKKYTGHHLPLTQVYPVAFVCYAFNLNLGAWVGGFALRYRLYSRLGLDVPTVTGILSINLMTNWLGYMILAGTVFSFRMMALPDDWTIGATTLQLIGFGLLAVSLGYLLACRFSRRRSWSIRGHQIELPALQFALLQVILSVINWSLMAALIYLLLPQEAFYPSILGVLLVSSIAGVITHIPGGLGVLETVFLGLLQHEIPSGTLIAALIGYRAVYFLLPLIFAVVTYLILEQRARSLRSATGTSAQGRDGRHSGATGSSDSAAA